MKPHTLTITIRAEGPTAGARVLDVTCPGVNDDCRSWIECDRTEGDPDCSDEGCMAPLPDCFLRRLGTGLDEAAEELPPGRHEFTATFNDYGDVDALTVADTTNPATL